MLFIRHKWKGARRARAVLVFDEFFSGFRAKFQKIVTCAAFSIKFAKTNQKFAENSEFCEKISLLLVNYSLHSLVEVFSQRGKPKEADALLAYAKALAKEQGVRTRFLFRRSILTSRTSSTWEVSLRRRGRDDFDYETSIHLSSHSSKVQRT